LEQTTKSGCFARPFFEWSRLDTATGYGIALVFEFFNDILDISKIEAGKMTIERVECAPCQLLAEVASMMRVRAIEKSLDLGVECDGANPRTIKTDPTRLRQILLNLVGNAIKFTRAGTVQIVAKLEREGPTGHLRFSIVDSGVGMTTEQQAKLFQPFVQADVSTTRHFGGTGLGLTICRRLAEMLGGNIEVSSALGQGSTFSIVVDTGPLDGIGLIQYRHDTDSAWRHDC
jgi:signal transduction histidine kinase